MIDQSKLAELLSIFNDCTHEYCDVHEIFPELKELIETLWRENADALEWFKAAKKDCDFLQDKNADLVKAGNRMYDALVYVFPAKQKQAIREEWKEALKRNARAK